MKGGAGELPLAQRQAGFVMLHALPDEDWTARWDRIICPDHVKQRLLNFALFCFGPLRKVSSVALPTHGLVVLAGPPGTGKTTLAHGLADRIARALQAREVASRCKFAVIDPHVLPSEMLGESQRGVVRLFSRAIPDLAAEGEPVIVLLDEVEALAVTRRATSTESNPVDVHRATEAVLTGLDDVAKACPNVLFVATTNHREAVDEALVSRADLIEELLPPSTDVAAAILADTLSEVSPALLADSRAAEGLHRLAARCVTANLDGRQIRKAVLRLLVDKDPDLALGRRPLGWADLDGMLGRPPASP